MNPSTLVEARKLTKTFSGQRAVDGIDFDIRAGEIVGFLGPNGAGKTTTIRMLLNILEPTGGTLTLFGGTFARDRAMILNRMNASSGTLTLPGKLSAYENLIVFADLYGLRHPKDRIRSLIKRFDLEDIKDRSLYSLSTGQQVRVSLAKAFLNLPRLLLLDEPTSSLDPDVADRVRSYLVSMVKEEGTTVFLTSHNMAEVEEVCTRVLFLNEGRIQAEGTPAELAQRIRRWTVRINGEETKIDRDDVGRYITEAVRGGLDIKTIAVEEPTLEDFFVHTARNPKKPEESPS